MFCVAVETPTPFPFPVSSLMGRHSWVTRPQQSTGPGPAFCRTREAASGRQADLTLLLQLAAELAWFQAPPRLDLLVVLQAPKLQDSVRRCLDATLVPPHPSSSSSTSNSASLCHPTPVSPRLSCRTARTGRFGVGGCGGGVGLACPSCLPPHTGDFVDVSGALNKC